MSETSLLKEYRELSPDVTKIFVLPKIPLVNSSTSYLYQLYKEFLINSSSVKVETFNAGSLPKIFFSRLKSEKTILHYHWFEFEDFKSFLGIIWKLLWIILYKIFGGKIIWTVHNRYPHHNKFVYLNIKIRRRLAHLANKLHVHCQSAINAVADILNVEKKKFFIVKHPDFPANIFSKEKAIANLNKRYFSNQLKRDDKIFLMFGAIAEYKGIKEIIEIFQELDNNNKLVIAGFVKKGSIDYFNQLKELAGDKNIFIVGSVIPDEDVPSFLNSANYVIFNYVDILTSGGIVLAINYKKNIIAPSLGCISEFQDEKIIFFEANENRKENLTKILNKFAVN